MTYGDFKYDTITSTRRRNNLPYGETIAHDKRYELFIP